MRVVAVKVMHDGLGDDAEFARKFDREAKAAATLTNPHVVGVFDQGVDQMRPYIVMEFVQGCTLRHVISRQAPLPPMAALDLMESIASALASAHEAGLVHRDVKPENVLIGDRGQVKVADFGLARAVSSQTATATQGLLIGTVSYLPPELVTCGRADSRSDVYSAGVVLFELLTGQKPHTGETPIQVAYSHVHSDIPAPSTLLAGNDPRSMDSRRIIPPYLDALVVACTRRRPEERPLDGRDLLRLVRKARRALSQGILDDPALTEAMTRSLRTAPAAPVARDEDTAPVGLAEAIDRLGAPTPQAGHQQAPTPAGGVPQGASPAHRSTPTYPAPTPGATPWQPPAQPTAPRVPQQPVVRNQRSANMSGRQYPQQTSGQRPPAQSSGARSSGAQWSAAQRTGAPWPGAQRPSMPRPEQYSRRPAAARTRPVAPQPTAGRRPIGQPVHPYPPRSRSGSRQAVGTAERRRHQLAVRRRRLVIGIIALSLVLLWMLGHGALDGNGFEASASLAGLTHPVAGAASGASQLAPG